MNEYCKQNSGKELGNEHLIWCSKLNTKNLYKYTQ